MPIPKNGNTYIYALSDPNTFEIRYIGQTCYPLKKRLIDHLSVARTKKRHTHVSNWINALLIQGTSPIIELIEENPKDIDKAEIEWISQFKAWGYRLVNHALGGNTSRGAVLTYDQKIQKYKNKGGRIVLDNLGNKYDSVEEAGRALNIGSSSIRRVLLNGCQTAAGRTFWFEGEPPKKLLNKKERTNLRLGKGNFKNQNKPFKDQYGNIYKSIKDAMIRCSVHESATRKALKGRASHSGGYYFRYLDDDTMPEFKTKENVMKEWAKSRGSGMNRPIVDNLGNTYISITYAANRLGLKSGTISRALNRGHGRTGGYIFSYLECE